MERERCENCARVIGALEPAMIANDHVVCRECYRLLNDQHGRPDADRPAARESLEVEDLAFKLGPAPKPPLFSISKIAYRSIQRLKVVTFDPDTKTTESTTCELDADLRPQAIAMAVERQTGKRVTKIVVLERHWEKYHPASKLEAGLAAIAVAGLLAPRNND